MPLFRALAKNMAPMTNADESPTNRLTLFPIYLSLFIVSTLCPNLCPELCDFILLRSPLHFKEIKKSYAISYQETVGRISDTFKNIL